MKARKWILPVCIAGGVLLLCLIGVLLFWLNRPAPGGNGGYHSSVGRVLIADSGSCLFIGESGAIVLSDRSEAGDLLDGLQTGDEIRITHDAVMTTYPAQTGVYACEWLGGGSIDDIPQQHIEQLTELGWLGESDPPPESCAFSAQYIRTDGYHEDAQYPAVAVIRSVAELNAYYEANKDRYDLGRSDDPAADTTIGFRNACEKYDDAYFEQQILLLILLEEGSGSNRHEVTALQPAEEGGLTVSIERKIPEVGTCDMAEWHIFVEPEPGVDVTDSSAVTVLLDGREPGVSDRVECSYGYADLSLRIPEGWEYEIDPYDPTAEEEDLWFGIRFRPAGEPEGWLFLMYSTRPYAVCGTGLTNTNIRLASRVARQGWYDSSGMWSFIVFTDTPGDYVVRNEGAAVWWEEYGDEAMAILETAELGTSSIGEAHAIKIAAQEAPVNFDEARAIYDFLLGVWTITFYTDGDATVTVQVDADGSIVGHSEDALLTRE